jgi:hypothetical protein
MWSGHLSTWAPGLIPWLDVSFPSQTLASVFHMKLDWDSNWWHNFWLEAAICT